MEGRKERMEKVFATRATWDINMMQQNRVAFCLLTHVLCLACSRHGHQFNYWIISSRVQLRKSRDSLLFRNWPSLFEGVLDNWHCKFLVLFSSGSNGKAVMSLLVKGTLTASQKGKCKESESPEWMENIWPPFIQNYHEKCSSKQTWSCT